MNEKPEISYDTESDTFLRDGRPISDEDARTHWDAVDADWTQGAYRRMCEVVAS